MLNFIRRCIRREQKIQKQVEKQVQINHVAGKVGEIPSISFTSNCRSVVGAALARRVFATPPSPPQTPPPSRYSPPGPPAFAARARIFCPRREPRTCGGCCAL